MVPRLVTYSDYWVGCYIPIFIKFTAFYHAKVFGKILLNLGQVHFVETEEVRHIQLLPGPSYELQKVTWYIYGTRITIFVNTYTTNIANQFA